MGAFTLGLVRQALAATLGPETHQVRSGDRPYPAGPGVYVHVDGTTDTAPVLYIGQGNPVAGRLNEEFVTAANYRRWRGEGWNQWQAAGAAIAPVLAAATDPVALVWPTADGDEAKAWELVLIRCSALNGATPPAQGGGWDWSRSRTPGTSAAYEHLTQLFNDQGYGGRLTESRPGEEPAQGSGSC